MLRHKEEAKESEDSPGKRAAEEQSDQGTAKQKTEHKSKASRKRKDLLERLQRVTADFANYQKRMARDAEEVRQWTKAEVIKSILPAIDDFEQALEAGKTAKDVPSLLAGFKLVHDHLLAMLSKEKVETIPTTDQRFDPAIHEAMMQQVSADHEPGAVIAELRKGYTMNGRTLRPARVIVSRSAAEEETPEVEPAKKHADEQDEDSGQ